MTHPISKKQRAAALLQGTQLAVMGGSIAMGVLVLCLGLLNGSGLTSLAGAGYFFFYTLLCSLVIVNGFVLFAILPVYLQCHYTPGRCHATLLGTVGGSVAFAALALFLAALAGWDFNFADKELWTQGSIAGLPWFYWIAGPLYGALVGLFNVELETSDTHIA